MPLTKFLWFPGFHFGGCSRNICSFFLVSFNNWEINLYIIIIHWMKFNLYEMWHNNTDIIHTIDQILLEFCSEKIETPQVWKRENSPKSTIVDLIFLFFVWIFLLHFNFVPTNHFLWFYSIKSKISLPFLKCQKWILKENPGKCLQIDDS